MTGPKESLYRIDKRLKAEIDGAIDEFGVPTDAESAYRLTETLHPIVSKYRNEYYEHDVSVMGQSVADSGLEIAPAPQRRYEPHATYDSVTRAIGFGNKPTNVVLELIDDETRELIKQSVPAFAFPDHPKAIEQVKARIVRSLTRHARRAGRDAVADSVTASQVRDARTKKPYRGRVGFARVLTGHESCPFCAMLASRGPVYADDTVLKRQDGRKYHDGCDCIAVAVVEGKPWYGEQAYKELEAQWKRVAGELTGADQWKAWQYSYRGTAPGIALRLPRRDGKLLNSAPYFDDEPLPRLSDLVKHSVWGWNRGDESITLDTPRDGHTFDSARQKGTFFPERWSDQDIADAIAATMEHPDLIESRAVRRIAYRQVDGVMVTVQWDYIKGASKPYTAYPVYGDGVEAYDKSAKKRINWEKDGNNQMTKARRIEPDGY